jgi:hypothetical protein
MSDNDEPTAKHLHVVVGTSNQTKQRAGSDPNQPANDDYDYRADSGQTGGGVDHNPMSDTQTMAVVGKNAKPKSPE